MTKTKRIKAWAAFTLDGKVLFTQTIRVSRVLTEHIAYNTSAAEMILPILITYKIKAKNE